MEEMFDIKSKVIMFLLINRLDRKAKQRMRIPIMKKIIINVYSLLILCENSIIFGQVVFVVLY